MLPRVARLSKRFLRGVAYVTAFAAVATVVHDWSIRTSYKYVSRVPDPIGIPQGLNKTFSCDTDYVARLFGTQPNPEMTLQFEQLSGGYSGPSLTRVTIDQGSNPDPKIPKSIIAKYLNVQDLPPRPLDERIFGIFLAAEQMLLQEPVFYRDYKDFTDPLMKAPHCYYAGIEYQGNRSPLMNLFDLRSNTRTLLLLEDLGSTLCPIGKDLPEAQVEEGIKALAKLHAGYWNKGPDLPIPLIYGIHFCQNWLISTLVPLQLNTKKIDKIQETWKGYHPIFDEMFANPKTISTLHVVSNNYRKKILPLNRGEVDGLFNNKTICHGDYHPGNQFYQPNGDVTCVDWQFFGKMDSASELVYFLNASTVADPHLDQRLMQLYYQELTQNGVEGGQYPYKQFEKEVAVRQLAMCASFMSFLADPEDAEKRAKNNPQMEGLNKIVPYFLQRIVGRAGLVVDRYGDDLDFPQIQPKSA